MKIKLFSKIILISLLVILIGGIFVLISFASIGFDLVKLSTTRAVESVYTEVGEATSLKIDSDISDITVRFGGEKIVIKYTEVFNKRDKQKTKVTVKEASGVIEITADETYDVNFNLFDFAKRKIDVTLPEGRPYQLNIEADTADIAFVGGAGGVGAIAELLSVNIETDTGDIVARGMALNITDALTIEVDTGDVELCDVKAKTFSISTDTGDIEVGALTAETVRLETDTGDIDGGSMTAGTVTLLTDTGDIDIGDGAIDAKNTEIKTSTGDVDAAIKGKQSDYTIDIKTRTGDSNLSSSAGGEKILKITTGTGDVEVDFTE